MQNNSASTIFCKTRLTVTRPMLNCKEFLHKVDGLLTGDNGRVAVLMLDLDRFRLVNEIAGHDVGEVLLGKVRERLIVNTSAECI